MIIRPVKHTVGFNTTDVIELSFKAPGGNFSWKAIRVSNYSPFLAELSNTSDIFNNPTQSVLPFQQNVYNYEAKQSSTIDVSFPLAQLTLATLTTLNLFYMIIEYGTEGNAFPGVYPANLGGQLRIAQ